jgi:hypothetical protein
MASIAGQAGDWRVPETASGGRPIPVRKNSTASPRRSVEISSTSRALKSPSSLETPPSTGTGGSNSASLVNRTPAAAASRARIAPDEIP